MWFVLIISVVINWTFFCHFFTSMIENALHEIWSILIWQETEREIFLTGVSWCLYFRRNVISKYWANIYSKHLFGLWQTWLGWTWMKWDSLHVKLQLDFDGVLYLLRYLSLFTSMEFWICLHECLAYYCWLSLSQTLISQPKPYVVIVWNIKTAILDTL